LLEIFEELHVEQGNRLMEHWNMPPVYRSAVDKHSSVHFDPDDIVLVMVRLVNVVTRACGLSFVTGTDQTLLELPEATLLGMGEQQLTELVRVLEESRSISFLPSQA
jgi:HD-like signal output (HDOD) protein